MELTERGFMPAHKLVWAFVLKVPCRLAEQLIRAPWPEAVKAP